MKIRTTIITENNMHTPGISKEQIEALNTTAWTQVLMHMVSCSDDKSENAYVESCELVEE